MKTGILNSLLRRSLLAVTAAALTIPATAPVTALAASEATFTFNGGGWGHGIGLSQYGARGYALKGKSHSWILAHYYQGTKLVTKPTETVKVNLDKGADARKAWRIASGTSSPLTVYQTSDKSISIEIAAGQEVEIETDSSGNTRAVSSSGSILKQFAGACSVSAGGRIKIVDASGPYSHKGVIWRGKIRFAPDTVGTSKSKAINYVDLEEYLYGVVPRESPSSWPAEALKAQAVAARSYAYQDAKDGRTLYCTTMSQVYNGYLGPKGGEAAATNKAVDATKGQLVWYGSQTKPVKTFFFSSSGGHTASIEHVWTSSTAQAYYKGVSDADSDSNPYYKWTAGPYVASDISAKVRSKVGASYSAPSPHVITGISLDRASSGYARYATVKWSNGASYKIRGDSLRSALGLRSTKFTVTVKSPITKYQQNSSKMAQSGIWSTVYTAKASGGSYARTSRYSSKYVVRFTGTGVSWIGAKSSKLGKAEVLIDGRRVAVVDQYASSAKYKQTLYSTTSLAAGEHTLTIKALKSKDRRSKAYGATVDRIYVVSGALLQASTPVYKYQEQDARIAEIGAWKPASSASYSGGRQIVASKAGSKIVVEFIGSRVNWIGSKGPDHGSARVSIDGRKPVVVSLNSPTAASQKSLYISPWLTANRKHRMEIEVLGASSGGKGVVSADQFHTTGGWLVHPTLSSAKYQQTHFIKTGYWKTTKSSKFSGGSHMYAAASGKKATFHFDGNALKVYGTKGPRYGKAAVYLDGVRVATVDLYKSTTAYRQVLYKKTGLSAKQHTVTVKVLGRKDARSTGTRVSVDAVIVAGRTAL